MSDPSAITPFENVDPDKLINSAQVRRLLGDISSMSLYRRQKLDPKFPAARKFLGRNYWSERQLRSYIRASTGQG